MLTTWQKNFEALRRSYPHIIQALFDQKIITSTSKNGFMPCRAATTQSASGGDAQQTCSGESAGSHLVTIPEHSNGIALFIGLGSGHELAAVCNQRQKLSKIIVAEPLPQQFVEVLEHVDLTPILSREKLAIWLGSENWEDFESILEQIDHSKNIHLLRTQKRPSGSEHVYTDLDQKIYAAVLQKAMSSNTTRHFAEKSYQNRLANLPVLQRSQSLEALRNCYAQIPAILVAAGPSLSTALPYLETVADQCLIIAADAALLPLMAAGIVPDIVTSCDLHEVNFEKLEPLCREPQPFDLVVSIKSSPLVTKRISPKNLYFAFDQDQANEWLIDGEHLIGCNSIFSNVAQLSLETALVAGADPIIFMGQDLAESGKMSTHADGVVIARPEAAKESLVWVDGASGDRVPTTDYYNAFRLQLEATIAAHPGRFFNATDRGAHIQGTEVISPPELSSFLQSFPKKRKCLWGGCCPQENEKPSTLVEKLVRNCQQMDTFHAHVIQAEKQIKPVIREIRAVASSKIGRNPVLPTSLQIKLQRLDETFNNLNAQSGSTNQIAELVQKAMGRHQEMVAQSQQLKSRDHLGWLTAELNRWQFVLDVWLENAARQSEHLKRVYDDLLQENKLLLQIKEAVGGDRDEVLISLTRFYCQRGEYAAALRVLTTLDPGLLDRSAILNYFSGVVLANLQDFDQANLFWQKALDLDPGMINKIRAARARIAGEWLSLIKRWNGPLYEKMRGVWFSRVFRIWPEDVDLLRDFREIWPFFYQWFTGSVLDDSGWSAESRQKMLQAWEFICEDQPDWYRLSLKNLHKDVGEVEAVHGFAQYLSEKKDTHGHGFSVLAECCLEAGFFDKAVQFLEEAVRRNTDHAVLWETIGDLLCRQNDAENALVAYERCFLALPERTETLVKMGDIYFAKGQNEAAKLAYEAALAKNPDLPSLQDKLQQTQAAK